MSRNRELSGDFACPICGAIANSHEPHACPPATLAAIDAANTRASRAEDGEYDPPRRSYDRRLRDGFRMLGGGDLPR